MFYPWIVDPDTKLVWYSWPQCGQTFSNTLNILWQISHADWRTPPHLGQEEDPAVIFSPQCPHFSVVTFAGILEGARELSEVEEVFCSACVWLVGILFGIVGLIS